MKSEGKEIEKKERDVWGVGGLPLNIFFGLIFFRVESLETHYDHKELVDIYSGGLINFRGVVKFLGGGLRNFRGVIIISGVG